MQFEPIRMLWGMTEELGMGHYKSSTEFYKTVISNVWCREDMPQSNRLGIVRAALAENAWRMNRRPYYRVWPKVLDILMRLDLEKVTGKMITPLPYPVVIQMPVADGISFAGERLHTVMVSPTGAAFTAAASRPVSLGGAFKALRAGCCDIRPIAKITGLDVSMDIGKPMCPHGLSPRATFALTDRTLEDELVQALVNIVTREQRSGMRAAGHMLRDCVRLYCTLCLIDNDECDLIKRIVLNRDKHKLAGATEEELLRIYNRAANRRGLGYDVGKDIEVIPHVRRPHYGLRWCGTGKTIPRIVHVKGCVVHKELVETVPSGFADKDH